MTYDEMVKETLHRIALGRAEVLSRAEYYADILLSFSVVIAPSTHPKATMGVTKHLVLYVNPIWFIGSNHVDTVPKVAGLLVHECEHPLRGIDRLEALPNKEAANLAGDAAINQPMVDEGWELPDGAIFPSTFKLPPGKTLEWYYERIMEEANKQGKSPRQLAGGEPSDDEGEGGSGSGDDSDDSGNGSGQGGKLGIARGACGSIGGNAPDDDLEALLDDEFGKSDAEVEAVRRQALESIESYMATHGRGSVPGRFHELVKTKIRPPSVNWRSLLRRMIRRSCSIVRAGSRDYSLSRPSLSSAFTGTVISGLVDTPLVIAIIRDTSLSMGAPQLEEANNEIFHAVKKSNASTVWLIDADISVHRCEKIKARDVQRLDVRGRGGTDFNLAFETAQKLKPRPNLIIYTTDGDGGAPEKPPPGIETIWCIVKTSYAVRPAKWGHLVVCDPNQVLRDGF